MKEKQILRKFSVPGILKRVQLLILILCVGSLGLYAQQDKTITGKVTTESGETLPGVSIIIKGTTVGTVTNLDGNYNLTVPNDAGALVVSYVGMLSQEIEIGSKTSIDVILAADVQGLEEVVVVGYGTQKKINLTGAISSVKVTEELGDRPVANVTSMLQGALPGLTVTTSNSGGEPGAALNINVRGAGTLTGNGGKPYILVDGIPYGEAGLNSLNPNDIEDVTVLKDAASAAIYGSKGAYGVILINTKKGKLGTKAVVQYSSSWAFSELTMFPNMADSKGMATMVNAAQINSGQSPWFTPERLQRIDDYANGLIEHEAGDYDENGYWDSWGAGYANNDWYDIYWADNVPRSQHDISVRGGDQKTTYYLSGSIFDQDGALEFGNDHYQRVNFICSATGPDICPAAG